MKTYPPSRLASGTENVRICSGLGHTFASPTPADLFVGLPLGFDYLNRVLRSLSCDLLHLWEVHSFLQVLRPKSYNDIAKTAIAFWCSRVDGRHNFEYSCEPIASSFFTAHGYFKVLQRLFLEVLDIAPIAQSIVLDVSVELRDE